MLTTAAALAVLLIALLALAGLRLLQLAYRAFDRRADEREGAVNGKRDTALSGGTDPRAGNGPR